MNNELDELGSALDCVIVGSCSKAIDDLLEGDESSQMHLAVDMLSRHKDHIVACVNACAGINPKAVPKLVEAAKSLLSRKKEGQGEDTNIFAEWDDLEDAIKDTEIT